MPDASISNKRETLLDRGILIAMTGSIACYKACDLVSGMVQMGARVKVMMTRSATKFVTPLSLEALTGFPVAVEMFGDGEVQGNEPAHRHIELARFAEIACVIPATANIIGKLSGGIADDLVSTTLLSITTPILVAPAMNSHLYSNPVVQSNIEKLRKFGYHVVEPSEGFLSCGEYGPGRLPERDDLVHEMVHVLRRRSGLEGKRVLVTAGRTEEPFDPVRYLTNGSSGKMGYAVARAAKRFGADVTLVSGPTRLMKPRNTRFIRVRTAAEMARVMGNEAEQADVVIMTAAVCDFSPSSFSEEKIRRSGKVLSVPLEATEDILRKVAKEKKGKVLMVGYALETSDVEKNARRKLKEKGIDIIVGNNPLETGAGFGGDFIRAVIVDRNGTKEELPLLEKDIMAERLMEHVVKFMEE